MSLKTNKLMSPHYTPEELAAMGFKSLGKGLMISRKASFYGTSRISIGDNVRIDDFCILSGEVTLGSHIHISAYAALYGSMGIELEDYTGVSPRATLFSAMDDFGGDYLIGPIHPEETTHVTGGKILLKRYAQIGSGTTLFPAVTIGEGTVVGAMSLVRKSLPDWVVAAGIPARVLRERSKGLLQFVENEK